MEVNFQIKKIQLQAGSKKHQIQPSRGRESKREQGTGQAVLPCLAPVGWIHGEPVPSFSLWQTGKEVALVPVLVDKHEVILI